MAALCHRARDELSATAVAISLLTGSDAVVLVAATDELARRRADLSFDAGEGPSREAWRARRPVLVPDLAATPAGAWPGYASRALESGLAAVFAFPLSAGAVRLGVLEVHSDVVRELDGADLRAALSSARTATAVLLDAQLGKPAGLTARAVALERNAEVYQAQGMLMVQLGVDAAQALARMRAHAFAHDQSVLDLARQIVAGRVFDQGDI